MKRLTFQYQPSSLVALDDLEKLGKELQSVINDVAYAVKNHDYTTHYAALSLPYDDQLRADVLNLVAEKKQLNPTMLVVIGIGGSNLGTLAVYQAIYGKFYNEQNSDIKVYFADTVDTDYIYDIVLLMEQELEKGHTVLINVISKSGTTTETIANFELFFYLLQKYYKDTFHEYLVVTTDKDSRLWKFAQEKNIACLPIPKKVGGRYSVFSAVGLFPLALLGVDIDQLHAGAQSIMPDLTKSNILQNIAALSAAIRAIHYKNGININDMFLFSVDLEGVGKWYRQLMGESIGKKFNLQKKEVNIGITPTVSIGSIDLHSVAQLYLGGPNDKFTNFVAMEKNKSNIVLPKKPEFDQLVNNLQEKSFDVIMNAIMRGTQTAYLQEKRPYTVVTMPDKSAHSIGQLLQLYMVEMVYLGCLLDVNPFDQPQVELYKKETRSLLKNN